MTEKLIIATILLGLSSGFVGTFSVLRKQSLIGDALSHSTFPGIIIAFMITKDRVTYELMLGAFFAAFISILIIDLIKKYSKTKFDSALSLILASFFSIGTLLYRYVQDFNIYPSTKKSGLKNIIFGQINATLWSDIYLLSIITSLIIFIVLLFWKEFKLFIFNYYFFKSLGFPSFFIRLLLNFITILLVIVGINIVGVVLMSAILIAPAVTSRLWSNKLYINIILSCIFTTFSGIIAVYISQTAPTGPLIVIILSSILILSLLFTNKKGIIYSIIRKFKLQKTIKHHRILINIYYEFNNEIHDYDKNVLDNYISNNYLIYNDSLNKYQLTNQGLLLIKGIVGDIND